MGYLDARRIRDRRQADLALATAEEASSANPHVSGFELERVSDTVVRFSAGQCRDSANVLTMESDDPIDVDITASGAGGLDTGSEANSTWYAINVIGAEEATTSAMLTAGLAAPTMPVGYVRYKRIGWVYNDASGNFHLFTCFGAGVVSKYEYNTRTLASITALDAAAAATPTALSLQQWVGPTGRRVRMWVYNAVYEYTEFRTTGETFSDGTYPYRVNADDVGAGGSELTVVTNDSQSIDYRRQAGGGGSNLGIYVVGWEDEV